MIPADGGPKKLHFDRPFLIYLKKRDAARPFFVMWVDNAELLQAWKGDSSANAAAKWERGGGGPGGCH
jgi:hypothetical protein